MESLLDIAERVKLTDPLCAGLLMQCWEDGACEIQIAISRDLGSTPRRTLIAHGCSGFLILDSGVLGVDGFIEQWLDNEHSPLEAV